MYLIRDIFKCKPGKAKELVQKFQATLPYMEKSGLKKNKILTDVVSNYWTVVLESEVETLSDFENRRGFTGKPEVREIMKDYMDLVEGGYREIFHIE